MFICLLIDCIYLFLDKPKPPSEFQHVAESVTETSVKVNWKPGFNGGLPQTFVIQYKNSDGDWINTTEITDSQQKEMNYTLMQLLPGTTYTAQIFAINPLGTSPVSDQERFTTLEHIGQFLDNKTYRSMFKLTRELK